MNVDDSSFECSQEFAFQDAHKAREGNQVDLCSLQFFNKCFLGIIIQFRAKVSGLDEFGGKISVFGMRQDSGLLHVTEHNRDFSWNPTGSTRVSDGDEIRASTRP